jgi:hypothetical protein
VTADRAANAHEVLASLAVRTAITTVPASVAPVILNLLSGVVAIPLRDAEPAAIELVGHEDRRNPLVAALASFARSLTDDRDRVGIGDGDGVGVGERHASTGAALQSTGR